MKHLKKRKQKYAKRPDFKPKPKYDWTVRYGNLDSYRVLCARTHAATFGRCCVCLKAKSEVIHHSRYLGDRDTPGINLFGTCSRCHKSKCHSSVNWIYDNKDPVWGNHNTIGFEKRLQASYKLLNETGGLPQGRRS